MSHRIMVVEDEKSVAQVVKGTLENFGYEVVVLLTHGEGVLEKIGECAPDLVIMDIVLHEGEIDGIDIAEQIHQSLRIPVIFLTGFCDDSYIERASATGHFGFILKPFRAPELRASVEMALSKSRIEAELRTHRDMLEDMVQHRTQELVVINVKLEKEVAERRLMEEQARSSEEKYRALAEASEDVIFVIDREDRVEYVNSFAAKKLGKLREEIIGTPRSTLFPEEIASHQKASLDRVFETGCSLRVETKLRYRGRAIWQDHYLSPLKSEDGNVKAVMGISRDVTEYKKTEERLTTSLREKEILLKEIHHRVKNSLQLISSLLTLKARRLKDPKILEFCEESRNRIKSMALIHENLYCSHDFSLASFGEHIRPIVSNLVKSYGRYDIKVIVESDELRLRLEHAIPLGLIINELVSNALKHGFRDRKGGVLKIAFHGDGEKSVKLVVSDDGVGFPDTIDFRESPSMGLTIVSDLVEQIEGTIELSRSEGTTFAVSFTRED
jgi:PAS domain S-box-containing protein